MYKEFYEDGEDTPHIYSETVFPRRSSRGIYDENILCQKCDGTIGVWDQHACEVLLPDLPAFPDQDPRVQARCYQLNGYSYERLKLFFMSLVWRAHHASHDFFNQIDLGPHADWIRRMLDESLPGSIDEYSVFLTRFDDPVTRKMMMNPVKPRLGPQNYLQFMFGGYGVFIKIDSRPTESPWRRFQLAPQGNTPVLKIVWETSPIRNAMARCAKAAKTPDNYDDWLDEKYMRKFAE